MARRTRPAHPWVMTTSVVLVVIGWAAGAWSAPITFNTALPVARGEVVLREQFVALRATRDATAADRDLRVVGGVSVLAYGVTGDLTLFGVLPCGELYVPEYFNDRIQVFGVDGTPKRVIGQRGNGPGAFQAPGGVAVAPNGDLFVADFTNQRVQQLRADGTFVRQWGTTGRSGHAAGQFIYPTDVALDAHGNLYVADGYGNRIQVFDQHGPFVRKWGGPFALGLYGPFNGWFITITSLVLGPGGTVFAAAFQITGSSNSPPTAPL